VPDPVAAAAAICSAQRARQ